MAALLQSLLPPRGESEELQPTMTQWYYNKNNPQNHTKTLRTEQKVNKKPQKSTKILQKSRIPVIKSGMEQSDWRMRSGLPRRVLPPCGEYAVLQGGVVSRSLLVLGNKMNISGIK